MAPHGTLSTNPGNGPGIDAAFTAGGVLVPTTVLNAIKSDGYPGDLTATDDGALNVSARSLAYEVANALREVPPYARDVNEQLRATIGNPAVYLGWADNGNVSTLWYRNPGGPASMDAREIQREQSTYYTNAHTATWTFS